MENNREKTFETGTVLNDKWVILDMLGRGGMGEVYRAHQLNLDRDVAIKVISKEYIKSLEGDTDGVDACLDRFRREVQVMAQVRHPNVLQIFDHGSVKIVRDDGEFFIEYIAMEYIPGGTLRDTMSEEGFYPEEGRTREWLNDYFLPLLDGVHALHEKQIIHRDLKPENVLLDGNLPKIADFGLSRSHRSKPFTQSVDLRGTPPYMSPEHFMDFKRADQRTDVYALGKILFEAIDGKITSDQIPFKKACLKEAENPFFKSLDRIIQDSTSEDKKERTPTVLAMKQAISATLAEPGKASIMSGTAKLPARFSIRRTLTWVGLVALLAFSGFSAFNLVSPSKTQTQTPGTGLTIEQILGGEIAPSIKPGDPVPKLLQGKDGSKLNLIPGGSVTLPRKNGPEGGKTFEVKPFYMDETKVTNHQYVDFLNQVLSLVKVENGVVWGDGRVWLMLGEVTKDCDPIGFRNGRFHVLEAAHSSCPVLRVTASGAVAYARHFGRRIPTEAEWMRAAKDESDARLQKGNKPSATGLTVASGDQCAWELPQTAPRATERVLPICSPVGLFNANAFGLKGIDIGGEWGVSIWAGEKGPVADTVVLGGFSSDQDIGADLPASIKRSYWEAFDEVGFRTVLSAPSVAN